MLGGGEIHICVLNNDFFLVFIWFGCFVCAPSMYGLPRGSKFCVFYLLSMISRLFRFVFLNSSAAALEFGTRIDAITNFFTDVAALWSFVPQSPNTTLPPNTQFLLIASFLYYLAHCSTVAMVAFSALVLFCVFPSVRPGLLGCALPTAIFWFRCRLSLCFSFQSCSLLLRSPLRNVSVHPSVESLLLPSALLIAIVARVGTSRQRSHVRQLLQAARGASNVVYMPVNLIGRYCSSTSFSPSVFLLWVVGSLS